MSILTTPVNPFGALDAPAAQLGELITKLEAQPAGRPALIARLRREQARYEAEAAAEKARGGPDAFGPQRVERLDGYGIPIPVCSAEVAAADRARQIQELLLAEANDPYNKIFRIKDLMQEDLPEPEFVVAGLVLAGLVILAGRPKSGKSWLAYALALAVAGGHDALGNLATTLRPVLYLALEDTKVRLKSRIAKLLGGLGLAEVPDGFNATCEVPKSGEGGLRLVERWLQANPGGVVVVDTLQKFRDQPKSGSGSYAEDYEQAGRLKKMADKYGGLVLVIHHTRKQSAADPFDEVSGTLGLTGAADATIVLERAGPTAALYVRGRDLADATFTLAWDAASCLWSVTGREEGVFRDEGSGNETGYQQCAVWIEQYLGARRRRDAEVESAAFAEGYTTKMIRMAKKVLEARPVGASLQTKRIGFGGSWWNWMGTPDDVPPAVPEPINASPPKAVILETTEE